jgi:hypothetical protein
VEDGGMSYFKADQLMQVAPLMSSLHKGRLEQQGPSDQRWGGCDPRLWFDSIGLPDVVPEVQIDQTQLINFLMKAF